MYVKFLERKKDDVLLFKIIARTGKICFDGLGKLEDRKRFK
jgi:hypothetical protein